MCQYEEEADVVDEEEDEENDYSRPKCNPNVYKDSLENLSLSPTNSTVINVENYSLDDEVFFPNNSDWELYLFAEEMAKKNGSKRRPVSFDTSQLQPKPSIRQFSQHGFAQDSNNATGGPSRTREDFGTAEERMERSQRLLLGRRNTSEDNIEEQSSVQMSRPKRYSHNGTYMKGGKNSITKRYFKK